MPISGFVAADRAASYTYTLEYAPGLEPLDAAFTPFATGGGTGAHSGELGNNDLPLADIALLLPGAAQGVPPADPYQYAFTVRLRVTDNLGNVGEDRKTLFAYHDPTMHAGWPKFVDTGGEQSLRFADLNGDGAIEIVAANTSGEIAVYNHDGTPASYFNGGAPFVAPVPPVVDNHLAAPAFTAGGIQPSRGGFTTPAIGDLDGDGYPEIVAVNGEQVYALDGEGSVLPGFPVSTNPAFSAPALRTKTNHVKPGVFSSTALGDLDQDGNLDIVVAAMDQHAYAWDASGAALPGWPVLLQDPSAPVPSGAETINTPAIGDINADGFPDVVVATNEIYGGSNSSDIQEAIRNGLLNLAAGTVGNSSRLYAIHHDGDAHPGGPFLAGWPVSLGSLDANLLPLVEPGVDAIIADVDPTSAGPEVINNAFAGDLVVLDGAGNPRYTFQSGPSGGASLSPGVVIQTAEHAAVADVTGLGTLALFKGGVPVEQLVNLLLVGQNVPFQHVIQGWTAASGTYMPGWPRAIDDYQIFSSPAVADVGGVSDREVIAGSGLGLLHAFGPSGAELPSFPKMTGGWLLGVTSVGDIDGDGLLEIANATREGHVFVWDTTGPACGGNSEWWGARHDDYNSGNYAVDSRPPSPILDLTAAPGPTLQWTAPGDDFACGTSNHYEVRYATEPITKDNWSSAAVVAGTPPTPQASGAPESFAVTGLSGGTVYFAARAIDDAGNLGPVSNNALIWPDTDGDGCTDLEENGTNALLGGLRDAHNRWDFYDVDGTRKIDAVDIAQVRGKFNTTPSHPAYSAIHDRRPGAAMWAPGSPDNKIDAKDIALVRASFNHDCSGPPN